MDRRAFLTTSSQFEPVEEIRPPQAAGARPNLQEGLQGGQEILQASGFGLRLRLRLRLRRLEGEARPEDGDVCEQRHCGRADPRPTARDADRVDSDGSKPRGPEQLRHPRQAGGSAEVSGR